MRRGGRGTSTPAIAQVQTSTADRFASLAARPRYEVDAEGRSRLSEAGNLRSDESHYHAQRMKFLEHLGGIVRESFKPMENIGEMWCHTHARAAHLCASSTWDPMAPQSPDMDRWLTWHYYTRGSEAFRGDFFSYSVDHDLREELRNIDGRRRPVIMMTGTYDYLTPPEATENTARQIKSGVYIETEDIGHFPMSENYPLFRVYLREALRIVKERKG